MTGTTPHEDLCAALRAALPAFGWGASGRAVHAAAPIGERQHVTAILHRAPYLGTEVWWLSLSIPLAPRIPDEFLGWDGDPGAVASRVAYHLKVACSAMDKHAAAVIAQAAAVRAITKSDTTP